VFPHVVLLVGGRLGGVHVEAGAELTAHGGGAVQRGVAQGERGVEAEQGAELRVFLFLAAADERGVFLQSGLGHVGAVAVRDLVAEAGAEARRLHRAGDRVERAADGAGAGVVIDEGRGAAPHRRQRHDQRADIGVVQSEPAVQPPPQVAELFHEVARRLGLAQAPHQGVDPAGQHRLPGGVDDAGAGGVHLGGRRDPADAAILDADGVVPQHPVVLTQRQNDAAPDHQRLIHLFPSCS
jgi:hypothetical protein